MKETSPDEPYIDRLRSWAKTKVHGGNRSTARRPGHNNDHDLDLDPSLLPISNPRSNSTVTASDITSNNGTQPSSSRDALGVDGNPGGSGRKSSNNGSHTGPGRDSNATTSPEASRKGSQLGNGPPSENEKTQSETEKPNVFKRFVLVFRKVIFHSWINTLLVFVPVGIAVNFVPNMSPAVIFAMNAIAIIPLAGLLSHATETVAHRMGDAIGALLNITFGNAVELIIFIALVKNEIRIVQASLLGSILANLLLILGMSFLLGGLRFREQIYNSTVTQMSACLLSLSVISLVLPTAFHASFNDTAQADKESLKISRGTSVVLLLVYIIYLLFQLKSHAYMYESTPQEVIDAESTPGPAVAWFDSSSSDDSSSSSSDSDSSGHSRDTVSKRVKRMVRHGRRRKSSVASMDTVETLQSGPLRSNPSLGTNMSHTNEDGPFAESQSRVPRTNSIDADESAIEDERPHRHGRKKHHKRSHKGRKHLKKLHSHTHGTNSPAEETIEEGPENVEKNASASGEPRRVDFAVNNVRDNASGVTGEAVPARRPFDALLSLKPAALNLAPTVFTQQPNTIGVPPDPVGPIPRVRYGIRRTNSLPGRLNTQFRAPGAMLPSQIPARVLATAESGGEKVVLFEDDLSRTSAVVLLLASTALVAVCAEFMVDSINGLVATSSISEAFIGLIILPIVGNAAEHVTAITVAMKNKMDLAIGVAVGSSIQIALFITPLVVILGWILNADMTLYFTLFETVCLFVSAFIANFLVLDGRSNYLEGALLCATYVIIGLVAFFYPNADDASVWGR
ncbi:Vacuolar calcium ion transporter [Cytospora mali]|uniref:Vacuolar calcium ion transporter n=1 Tax=Cytospora mali TaxID=578113 RepID=A0A194W460_CYTMA|nr:Vacuolar calcium ion transporter [Valsa mali]